MQLEVKFQEIKPVESNFESLKVELKEQLEKYQNLVVVEEDLPKYKEDKAKLNKLKKALNDQRIRVKKEFTAPITAFESQVKELIVMVDDPVKCLDDQLKKFEEKRKEEKKQKIVDLFTELNDIDQFKLTRIFDESWLNVSVSMKKIKETITTEIEKIHADIQAITDLQSEFEDELQKIYLKNFSLSEAINRNNEYNRIKEKQEAERKAKEHAEKERIEREKQVEIKRKEQEAQAEIERLKKELESKDIQVLPVEKKSEVLDVPEKTPEQRLKEANNPEVYYQNNVEPQVIDFRVWVTPEQKTLIKDFLVSNNIKYGPVK